MNDVINRKLFDHFNEHPLTVDLFLRSLDIGGGLELVFAEETRDAVFMKNFVLR